LKAELINSNDLLPKDLRIQRDWRMTLRLYAA